MKRYLPVGWVVAVFAIAAVLALLTGCASQPIEAQLATACNQLSTAYTEAAILKANGKLSDTAIKVILATIPTAEAACDPTAPPSDLTAALTSATAALQQITLASAGVH